MMILPGAGALALLDALDPVRQRLTEDFEPLRPLPGALVRQLGNWESEAYRKRLETKA